MGKQLVIEEDVVMGIIRDGSIQERTLMEKLFGKQITPKLKLGDFLCQRSTGERYILIGLYSDRVSLVNVKSFMSPWPATEVADKSRLTASEIHSVLKLADFRIEVRRKRCEV